MDYSTHNIEKVEINPFLIIHLRNNTNKQHSMFIKLPQHYHQKTIMLLNTKIGMYTLIHLLTRTNWLSGWKPNTETRDSNNDNCSSL